MEKQLSKCVNTTEMHTGGEPFRIVESGVPEILGATLLDKRRYMIENLDEFRRFVMLEPRGHKDMFGGVLVAPDLAGADLAVLFMDTVGYGLMCGHGVIALARYAVDKGLVKVQVPETRVGIQAPCGLVEAAVRCEGGVASSVRFRSVPAFAFALDVEIDVPSVGKIQVDIGYGGVFYAIVPAAAVGLSLETSEARDLADMGHRIKEIVKKVVTLNHPKHPELAYLNGTIITDGKDDFGSGPTRQVCVFADHALDRSPCGSGVTARLAVQHVRGLVQLDRPRTFLGAAGSEFSASVVRRTRCRDVDAVVVEVVGRAFCCGTCSFTGEALDELGRGFLII